MNDDEDMTPRLLPLRGLYNVRDLGGYPLDSVRAGRSRVKRGLLYRGGDLCPLSPEDRAVLEQRDIRTVVDFRDGGEKETAPDGAIGTARYLYELPIEAGNTLDFTGVRTGTNGTALMEELYRLIVDEARPQYRELFGILSEPRHTPLLFHCAAGKDRTGIGAALILSALGVNREIIYDDYLLSAVCLKDKYASWIAAAPHSEPLMSVRRSYLDAAFDAIDGDFGGVDAYVRDELGVDTELLRALYTE
jgi:protein-tyrosine phosphatase